MSGYDNSALVNRIKVKATTSTTGSLTDQDILDLVQDSLVSYLVPLSKTLREEYWICPDDIVKTSDANGGITLPDTVASTLRTVSWSNNGVLTPLTRIEPELSFDYLATSGTMPVGYELRGYRLQLLPKVANVSIHLTAMIRPPELVLSENAGLIDSIVDAPGDTTLEVELTSFPVPWQEQNGGPAQVDVISPASPFSKLCTCNVLGGDFPSRTVTIQSTDGTILDPGAGGIVGVGWWLSDVGKSPFPNVPTELMALLQQDAIVQLLGTALGDKRLPAAEKRRDFLENLAKRTLAPRTTGSARVIVNKSAPGMRGGRFGFGR